MNSVAHNLLLWLKMSFPLIGDIGNVPKKDPMTHMSKPAPPTAGKPAINSRKKNAAKPKLTTISITEAMAPSLSVSFFSS